MAATPAVKVVITGDSKGLEKSLKKSAKGLGSFGDTALGVFGGNLLTKGFDAAIGGIEALGKFALGGIDKLDAMGDSMARLDGLASGLGNIATKTDLTKFGVDKNEAAQSALSIAKTARALGVTGKQTKVITPRLQKMAAQLASLGDGDPAKQADLLAKALAGNAKAAKALGIALPKGNKPLQNYQLLVKKLGPKLDQATAGQASLADVGERWDATLVNLQLQLAGFLDKLAPVISALLDALIPALTNLVNTVGPMVETMFANIGAAIQAWLDSGGAVQVAVLVANIGTVMTALAGFITGTLVPAFLGLVDFINKNVVPIWSALADAIVKNVQPLIPKVQGLADALGQMFSDLLPILAEVYSFISTNVVPLLRDVVLPILSLVAGIVLDVATALIRNLVPALRYTAGKFNDFLTALQPVFDLLNKLLGLAGNVIGKLGDIHLPSIPGINAVGAPATAGVSSRGASPVSITIQTGVGDPVAIGRTVARYLGAYQLRGGSIG